MARKRRTSPLEDLIELASLLPYWLSLVIAVATYLFFHSFAIADIQPVIKTGSAMPENIGLILFWSIAVALQYLVPAAFVLGAIVSGFKAFQGRRLLKQYVAKPVAPNSSSTSTAELNKKPTDDMTWQQFELLVGEAFRRIGYQVIDGGDVGADGGVDVHLSKGGQKFLVQCKHWKTRRVGVSIVREHLGVLVAAGAKGGFIVTSGSFTGEARDFAEDKPITLINGTKLDKLIRSVSNSLPIGTLKPSPSTPEEPSCPKCASPMVKRKARRGAHAGQEFWGCSKFPVCHGIAQLK